MSLPPGVLAQKLVTTFPQLILCDLGLAAQLRSQLDPLSNPDMQQILQWLEDHPSSAGPTGDALNPSGQPARLPAPLGPALVQALLPPLAATSAWIAGQPAFEGVAWTVQTGVMPGPEAPQPATGGWHLTTEAPVGGLAFRDVAFSGPAARAFTLSLVNGQPRHLGVYVEFTAAGMPVAPAGWTSRLPAGAPPAFETETVKYLGLLAPNANVAGLSVDPSPQSVTVALPSNADAVRLLFGGLGAGPFAPVPDAAGMVVTLVLDVFVPWLVQASGQDAADHSAWFDGLVSDAEVIAGILAGSAFLAGAAGADDAMIAALSANLTGLVLGPTLSGLRSSVTAQLGTPPGQTYGWVDRLAPAAGWPAQLLGAFLAGGLNPGYWAAAAPSTFRLDLSPATTLQWNLTLAPDPAVGAWPPAAAGYEVAIAYAAGFTQTMSGSVPGPPADVPLVVSFGSVRDAGPIDVSARVSDAAGTPVASREARIAPEVAAGSRTAAARISVVDVPIAVGPTTRYACALRLTCEGGAYAWAAVPRSGAVGVPARVGQAPALTALNDFTLQAAWSCLGYAWGASGQAAPACAGGPPLQNSFFMQNVGTVVPSARLKTIACGLTAPPLLAYAGAGRGSGAGGHLLDTRGPIPHLRPVSFAPGSFDLGATTSVAAFPARSGPVDVCLHPAGYAAAVCLDLDLLLIAALAPTPLPDAQAPMALAHGGPGTRTGLLGAPVAVAVTPGGVFLVLEQGNARVQAFDVNGNPVPLFGGQPCFALRADPNPTYADLTVSTTGLIYVLGSRAGGATAADFFLDIYDAGGAPLARTPGVNAAKIALDAGQTLYTLDFDALTGPGGRTEPVVSLWRPSAG